MNLLNKLAKMLCVVVATIGVCNCSESYAAVYPKMDDELITFMKDGGWCWYQDPRAIIHNGKLIIGGLNGQNGDVRVGVYDLKEKKMLGAVILHHKLEVDDHDAPAFYVRPDGSVLAVWGKHSRENIHYYSISDTEDYLKWSETKIYEHDFKTSDFKKSANYAWAGICYQNLYTIEKKGEDKTLYNFFRLGLDNNSYFITSDDNGDTWCEHKRHFISNHVAGFQRPYVKYTQISKDRVGLSYTDAHPAQYGNNIYYNEFDGRYYYNAAGEKVHDLEDGPLSTAEGDLIYRGSESFDVPEGCGSVPNSAWSCWLTKDSKSRPQVGYTVYMNNDDIRYRLANWTGRKWNDREIALGGTCLYAGQSSYSGLLAVDPTDSENVAISSNVDPKSGKSLGEYEIFIAKVGKKDSVETIDWEQLTFDSENKNIRPLIVEGEGYKVLIWLAGPWKSFLDYDSDVVGYIVEGAK